MAPLRARLHRLASPRMVQTLAGLADQAVISIANLGAGLLVIHLGTKTEYGFYGLGYTAVITLTGLSAALFNGQLTILYFGKPEGERDRFAGTMTAALLVMAITLALAAAAIAAFITDDGALRALLVVTILAVPTAMAQDFLRSYAYLREGGVQALVLDVLNGGLWLGLSAAGWHAGIRPDLAALGAYGIACAITVVAGILWWRLPLRAGRAAIGAVREAWVHGSWALGGVVVTAIQNQAHLYVLGLLDTVQMVAEVSAARLLMAPLPLLIVGVHRAQVPRLARFYAEGAHDAMRRDAQWVFAGLMVVIALYAGTILALPPKWLAYVLPRAYQAGLGPLVALWAAVFAFRALDYVLSSWLQVTKRFRDLTLLNLVTAIPVALALWPMVFWFGAIGSMAVQVAGQAGLALMLLRSMRRQPLTPAAS